MSEEKKEKRDMTISLFPEENRKENGPDMTGVAVIAGVELRVAVWPARKAAGSGKVYRSGKLEYKRGATKFLAPISPADITGANVAVKTSTTSGQSEGSAAAAADDMPF